MFLSGIVGCDSVRLHCPPGLDSICDRTICGRTGAYGGGRRARWGVAVAAPYTLDISGLPDYSKITAATLGMTLGCLIFDPVRILKFRPRWFDLPMLLWCFTGLCSSLQNGLGPYDGLADSLTQILTWGLPYLFGRLYFGDPGGLALFRRRHGYRRARLCTPLPLGGPDEPAALATLMAWERGKEHGGAATARTCSSIRASSWDCG